MPLKVFSGTNARRIRTERELSIRELSRVSGLALGYISQLETGKRRNPTLTKLSRLAAALGVPVEDLLSAPTEYPRPPPWASIGKVVGHGHSS
ncbi:MAG TPA: helix-turn-helix transcriptional regulator [Symbiobacteriaceae bacterium]